MDVISKKISDLVFKRQQSGLYRQKTFCNDRSDSAVSFMTNDYLGLSSSQDLKKHNAQAFLSYPIGSGSSPVVSGRSVAHERLEETVAKLTKSDSAILFNSGYQANLAILMMLGQLDISLVIDKAIHASIYDGIELSKLAFHRFRHLDVNHMQQKLSPGKVVITEGIFSMSGLSSPLDTYASLVSRYQCGLVVDESHSFGVLGDNGMGACEHYRLNQSEVPIRMISFAKAAASMGAVVVGQKHWIDAITQFARPYMYSTSMSPALAHALSFTLTAIVESKAARVRLQQLSDYFNEKIVASGMNWRANDSQIKQLQVGCADKVIHINNILREHNVYVQAIRTPTVPAKETCIRISLTANHQYADIDLLFDLLHKAWPVIC